jgi:hypothetical protein
MLNQKLGNFIPKLFNTKNYDKINFENRVRFIAIY